MIKKILSVLILTINVHCHANYFIHDFHKMNPHRVYFGPEYFLFDLEDQIQEVTIKGCKSFFGLRLGYEYLKPKAFYGGIEIFGAGSNRGLRGTVDNVVLPTNSITGFGNIDLKFGYTLSACRILISPFLGIGSYSFGDGRKDERFGFEESFFYYSGGIRSKWEIVPSFNIGLNIKILHTEDRKLRFRFSSLDVSRNSNVWGSEVGIPLIWMFSCPNWNVQLEPYFLNFYSRGKENIYGTKLQFGYRF